MDSPEHHARVEHRRKAEDLLADSERLMKNPAYLQSAGFTEVKIMVQQAILHERLSHGPAR